MNKHELAQKFSAKKITTGTYKFTYTNKRFSWSAQSQDSLTYDNWDELTCRDLMWLRSYIIYHGNKRRC
jgi:uncharacterized Rossmann fold enzyme